MTPTMTPALLAPPRLPSMVGAQKGRMKPQVLLMALTKTPMLLACSVAQSTA